MMKYSYKVKRRKRSIEELNYYQELYGDARDEFGDLNGNSITYKDVLNSK